MVEFKIKDGEFYLMEINARFWGSLPLAVYSGVNFPLFWASNLLDLKYIPKNEPSYKKRYRWLIGDLNHLFEVLIGRKNGLGKNKSRLKTLKSWIYSFFIKNTVYLNLGRKDHLAVIGEIVHYIKND